MSTSCTVTRLVRWRVRDWVSCFHACRFPLDEEEEKYRLSTEAIDCQKGETRSKKHNRKMKHDNSKACNQEVESTEIITINKAAEEASDYSSCRHNHFAAEEEDYIVFCFEENGAVHVIEGRRLEASDDQINSANIGSSKPVNLKGEKPDDNIADTEWPPDEIKEISHIDQENNESKPRSLESSNSTLSDSSTSSFTFPVLGVEGMGSPVQMPEFSSENLSMKKPKERCARLQCCRF